MKILVTGGAGFIGSHLVRTLVNKKNDVYVVDDLSMGRIENISDLSNVRFFHKSVCDYGFMHRLLVNEKFDHIYFLAAIASVADSIKRPKETHMVNSEAIIDALECIRINHIPVKKILFSSSAAVYGDGTEIPKREESSIRPLSPYAIDKFSAERYMIDYGNLYNLPTVCVRFFNVFGPNQNPSSPYSGVLSILTKCMNNDEVFNIFGDGTQTRDFIYVEDVIQALLLIMKTSKKSTVFNVANGEETSLNALISMYEEISNKKIRMNILNRREGDVRRSVADISRLKKLGFSSQWSIKDGLKNYWNSVRS